MVALKLARVGGSAAAVTPALLLARAGATGTTFSTPALKWARVGGDGVSSVIVNPFATQTAKDAGALVTLTASLVTGDTPDAWTWRVVSVTPSTAVVNLTATGERCEFVAPAAMSAAGVPLAVTVVLGVTATDTGVTSTEKQVTIPVYPSTEWSRQPGGSWLGAPTAGVAPVPNTVTMGGDTHILDGINPADTVSTPGGRGANQLVEYTLTSPTATNQFGVEVVVSKTTGLVVSINNRIAANDTTGTSFTPATQYVLSGHGQGTGYAGQWLLDHAVVGQPVVLSNQATPGPTTPPPSGDSSGNKLLVFHQAYVGPQPFTDYPTSVQAAVDIITLLPAISAASGTGRLNYPNRFGGGLATSIAAAKANGVDVVMGIGGAGDGGITVLNSTQANEMVASVKGFVDSYGIVGIDFDLENVSNWNVTNLALVANTLKSFYGSSFIVGITAGYYPPQDTQYKALAAAIGSNLDYFSLMEYDYSDASVATTYANWLKSKIADLISSGVPESKIIWGMAVRDPDAPSYTGYSPSVAFLQGEWDKVAAVYPNLKGAFIYEDKIMAARTPAWDWVTGMTSRIHA